MSKQGKRKITVELPKSKDLANRPSVFERLGTKKASSAKKTSEHCRQWAQHGTCPYGKSCKFASTHTLISPSKQRAAIKDSDQKRGVKDDGKSRLHSTVVVRRSPDGEIDNWDQNDLEYADTDVLEKRRLQLQRELELQLKMDSSKEMRKDKKKVVSSSSSSRSSSSSSVSSSSSDGSSSSSSSGRDAKRKGKKVKLKRNSSSSSDGDVPSKKKLTKNDSTKRDKNAGKKSIVKKDDKLLKKHEADKKKTLSKAAIGKNSLSPGKKSGGTPPITSKTLAKSSSKHSKSPQRRDRNRSISPHSARDRDKDRDKKEREKDRDKDNRDKDRDRVRGRSRSPKKGRSRSPRPHGSHSKDLRRKESSERSRPVSPKKQARRDGSSERHRKKSTSRDRGRDNKDKSTERRKEKHDDKDRHDRKDRGRDRNKESKRDDSKRRGRDRGLGGGRGGTDKGLEKPNKPMERLLPRPEERLAALAAISNRALETDKNSTTSKDRQDSHSERGGRNKDRLERDRSSKRDRMDSMDREQGEYEMGMDHQYDHDMEHYDRADDHYDGPRDGNRSPGYRDRHYDPGYDMPGPARGYPDDDERIYGDHMGDHRGVDVGYDDRRPHRDRSWEGRSGSMDRERGYMHPHKDWDNEDYRAGGDWVRGRHWSNHDAQMNEWGEKDPEMEGWRHRGHPGPHRGRMHEYGRGVRMDMRGDKRRGGVRSDASPAAKETPPQAPAAVAPPRLDNEVDDKPIPDDLSEISDDPDDILNREDMGDQNMDEDSQTALTTEDGLTKPESSEKESTQDTSGAGEEKETQDQKDDEDVANLDFEEISDGELEEERTRAGLGDALGVDWASLVADVRRREQTAPAGGARDRWRPERVLARLGVSIDMAGKDTVQHILKKNAESQLMEEKPERTSNSVNVDSKTIEQNGKLEEESPKPEPLLDINSLHPVASIQVAVQKRKKQRAVLFGSGCEITRGLSARRDLALRRYLCNLPVAERTGQSRVAPQPSLFHAARALLMQAPVSG